MRFGALRAEMSNQLIASENQQNHPSAQISKNQIQLNRSKISKSARAKHTAPNQRKIISSAKLKIKSHFKRRN